VSVRALDSSIHPIAGGYPSLRTLIAGLKQDKPEVFDRQTVESSWQHPLMLILLAVKDQLDGVQPCTRPLVDTTGMLARSMALLFSKKKKIEQFVFQYLRK
jgi:hypothetical protein